MLHSLIMSKTANSQHLRESNHVPSEMSTNKAIEESQLSKRNIFLESNIPQNGQMSRYSSSQQNCLNSKHANEIKAINHTLTYCLNTQTQMAKALTEIGQYLKTMNESNSSAIRVPRRIPNTMVKTGQSDCISLPKAEDKTKLDVCLQVLIAKFEQMQTQLMAKLKELEMSQGSSSSPDSICQSTVDSNTKYDPNNHNKSKLIASIRAESGVNGSTYDKSGLNSKKDFNFGLNAPGKDQSKPKVDESMFSRSDNIHSSENSPDTKHNVPASDSEKIVVGRNFDRAYAVSGDFDNFTKIDFNTRKPKSTRDTNSVFTSPTSGMTARSSTNKVLPIVLKMRSNPVSYQEIKCNYLTSRGLENKEDQKYCSNLQSYRNSMRTESECVEIDQGVKENQLNSQGSQKRESKEDLIYYGSGAQTSRDIATGFFTPREYPRPQMSSLLKKEIIDESMENTLDKTVNMDKLMQGFDKKPLYETPWTAGLDNQNILNADTQRIARSQLLVAQKERDIIKLLMKDEYGEARPAYHKGNLNPPIIICNNTYCLNKLIMGACIKKSTSLMPNGGVNGKTLLTLMLKLKIQ